MHLLIMAQQVLFNAKLKNITKLKKNNTKFEKNNTNSKKYY